MTRELWTRKERMEGENIDQIVPKLLKNEIGINGDDMFELENNGNEVISPSLVMKL